MEQINNPQQNSNKNKKLNPANNFKKYLGILVILIIFISVCLGVFYFAQMQLANQNTIKLTDSDISQISASSSIEQEVNKNYKYVETIANGSAYNTGLNWRESPCGQISGSVKRWGNTGIVVEGPIKKKCNNGQAVEYDWYKILWVDGSIGWSIADNLQITDSPNLSKVGFVDVSVDFKPYLSGEAEQTFKGKVCAYSLSWQFSFCSEEVDLKVQSPATEVKYEKFEIPEGDYIFYYEKSGNNPAKYAQNFTGTVENKQFETIKVSSKSLDIEKLLEYYDTTSIKTSPSSTSSVAKFLNSSTSKVNQNLAPIEILTNNYEVSSVKLFIWTSDVLK
jgi:hypothetical protein